MTSFARCTAQASTNAALAAFFVNLFAITPEGAAEVLVRFIAASLPEGVAASLALEARASGGDFEGSAGLYIDSGVTATADGDITVKAGAVLRTPVSADGNGGRVMLVGANVTNAGKI